MATKTLRPMARSFLQPTNRLPPIYQQHRRTFVSNPFSGPSTLVASRTLQYPHKVIFDIISDVSSYHHFIPYCVSSEVTKHSNPAPSTGKTYPEEAYLTVGFDNNVSEKFYSRIYCVPDTVVEAVSGNSVTSLKADEIGHHNARPERAQDPSRNETILTHLSTRWTLRPFPYKPPPTSATHPSTTHMNHAETSPIPGQEKTEVSLAIEYEFANPMYGALSSAAAPKVAEKMIEAFEKRVKAVVEGPASVNHKGSGTSERILRKR